MIRNRFPARDAVTEKVPDLFIAINLSGTFFNLDVGNVQDYSVHVLERADWRRDIHFQTQTTIDTLDYTGTGLNQGSKAIIATAGNKRKNLTMLLETDFSLTGGFKKPLFAMPGVLVVEGPSFSDVMSGVNDISRLAEHLEHTDKNEGIGLIVVTEDSEFASRNINNFLWVTFTRSNPAADIHGVGSFIRQKHWGCRGPLVIDARLKPHHAPPLIEDPAITKRVDQLGVKGGCLHGII